MEGPGGPGVHPNVTAAMRRMKFPRTRRERFIEEGRLYDVTLTGPAEPDGQPGIDPLTGATFGPGPMHMAPYPYPAPQLPPAQHNVTWAGLSSTSGEEGSTEDDSTSEASSSKPTPQPGNNNDKPTGALTGMALPSGRVPEEPIPANGSPRNWMQIDKMGDDADGPPVLGPPGRTPPPVRKNFKFPEEVQDDEDDVFYDETVPEVVFNDEFHHPAYGNYIPGQYQHTLNYLYGLETIRETDESMLHGQETFKEKASSCDMLVYSLTLIGYLVNVGADIWLAYEYLVLKHYMWFALTLTFIVLPSLSMTIFSLVLYIQDQKVLKDKVSKVRWFCRTFFLVLLMAPVMRTIDTLHFGLKSRTSQDWRMRRRYYDRMRDEDTDANLIRLFETFLENAPQLVLQLYIIVRIGTSEGTFLVTIQIIGLVMSLVTMAWSLVSFHSSLRSSLPDKAEIGWLGKMSMFIWRLFTITARVVSFALFASHFEMYIFAVLGGHFIVMFLWMTRQKTSYCLLRIQDEEGEETKVQHSAFLEFLFRMMAAFVHIFCFFNLLEGHTRLRCLVYYILVYIENTVLILSWNIIASTLGHGGWYQMPAVAFVMGGFFVGIIFQITYYLWCHPNRSSRYHRHRRIRLWVPCAELSLFNELQLPTEIQVNEQKPVFENKDGLGDRPGYPRPEPPRSEFAASAVSTVGPIMPMETSTPAPSMIGFSPPDRKPPEQIPPPPAEAAPSPPVSQTSPDRPTLPIQATDTPVSKPQPEPRTRPIPAPRQPRPTTPAKELEAERSRPTTPARELDAQRSRPTTPARELEGNRSRPTTPARELDIRGEFEPKTPEPQDAGGKFETEV